MPDGAAHFSDKRSDTGAGCKLAVLSDAEMLATPSHFPTAFSKAGKSAVPVHSSYKQRGGETMLLKFLNQYQE